MLDVKGFLDVPVTCRGTNANRDTYRDMISPLRISFVPVSLYIYTKTNFIIIITYKYHTYS